MKNKLFYYFTTALLLSCMLFNCEKQEQNQLKNENVEFTFNLNANHLKSTSDSCETLQHATKIVLTIETILGGETEYTDTELELYKLNGSFFSPKIALLIGGYKLTKLLLIDDNNNVLFAAALEGSLLAQHVNEPLPIEFEVIKDQANSVNVDVVCAIDNAPEDFGLASFWLNRVETFSFMITVAELGVDLILDADLTVASGDYSYCQHIEAIANNLVAVKDGFENYILLIEKEGYQPYEQSFTNAGLNEYFNIPLVVELVKEESTDLVDIDGNVYQTVELGLQIWMAENLKVTRYSNGDSIPLVTDRAAWAALGDNNTDKAYCFYNNNTNGEKDLYGALYTWAAIMNGEASSNANPSGVQGVCPVGWHLPSDAEWTDLEIYLGMSETQVNYEDGRGTNGGSKMAARADLWIEGYLEADPEFGASGFAGLPAGHRLPNGNFDNLGRLGIWLSSSESGTTVYRRLIGNTSTKIYRGHYGKSFGRSVRCIRD